jgi:hypothetical protein
MRSALVTVVLLAAGVGGQAGQGGKDETALDKSLAKADVVVVGKVTKNGLSANSNRDIAELEVSEVLLGEMKGKTTYFVYSSPGSGGGPKYGKVGTEGVWVLTAEGNYKEGTISARGVLAHQPLADLETVKKAVARLKKKD